MYDEESLKSSQYRSLDPRDSYTGTPYPFGMDPVWQVNLLLTAITIII